MKALALTSAAALFALASLAQADAVHANGGVNADSGYAYEEVNPKVGRMPILDPQPNAREYEPAVNSKIGMLPVLTPTRASNEGWIEVNAKQGRIPAFDAGTEPRELAGF